MIVFHGSITVVETPKILKALRMLDFGEGFYATSNKDQAIRWAQRNSEQKKTEKGYITEYDFDIAEAEKKLSIIRFNEPDEAWLDFVCSNRSGRIPDLSYDIAIGPVANDTVYTVVQLYENGIFDKDEAIKRFKVRPLYDQVLFHTERALSFCRYLSAEAIERTDQGNG